MIFYVLTFVAVVVCSYLIGNINFAIIISKFRNRDIRTLGSGNPGTMNMLRNFGKPLGAVCLVLDALKGAIPTLFGWLLLGWTNGEWALWAFSADKVGALSAGIAVIIGHIFPVFFKFKGGKGVASTIGVAFVACCGFGSWWWMPSIGFLLCLGYLYIRQYGCFASMIATGVPLVYLGIHNIVFYVESSTVSFLIVAILSFILYFMVVFAHRGNIKRYLRGEEKKTTIFGQDKRKAKKLAAQQSGTASEKSEEAAESAPELTADEGQETTENPEQ